MWLIKQTRDGGAFMVLRETSGDGCTEFLAVFKTATDAQRFIDENQYLPEDEVSILKRMQSMFQSWDNGTVISRAKGTRISFKMDL